MKTRALPALALAILLTACSISVDASPSAEGLPSPEPTPRSDCGDPTPDVTALVEHLDPLACYGAFDLTFEVRVEGIGVADCPGELQPEWFACGSLVGLVPPGGTSSRPDFVLAYVSDGPDPLYAVLHPDVEHLRAQIMGDATITGHYDDPASTECRITSWPEWDEIGRPSRAEVIHQCRSTFVVIAIEPVGVEPAAAPTDGSGFVPGDIARVIARIP